MTNRQLTVRWQRFEPSRIQKSSDCLTKGMSLEDVPGGSFEIQGPLGMAYTLLLVRGTWSRNRLDSHYFV